MATKYPGGIKKWRKQKSDVKCKCGCGEFITNRSKMNLDNGNDNAGYLHGHIWKGRKLLQSHKDKMNANRADFSGKNNPMYGRRFFGEDNPNYGKGLFGTDNPNYGKGLFGKDNPNWQGGRTLRYREGNHPGIGSVKNREFRKKIRFRDGCCILCGKEGSLDVHHIDEWMESEERRFDPQNCVSLCRSCHSKADRPQNKDRIRPMLEAYVSTLSEDGWKK